MDDDDGGGDDDSDGRHRTVLQHMASCRMWCAADDAGTGMDDWHSMASLWHERQQSVELSLVPTCPMSMDAYSMILLACYHDSHDSPESSHSLHLYPLLLH